MVSVRIKPSPCSCVVVHGSNVLRSERTPNETHTVRLRSLSILYEKCMGTTSNESENLAHQRNEYLRAYDRREHWKRPRSRRLCQQSRATWHFFHAKISADYHIIAASHWFMANHIQHTLTHTVERTIDAMDNSRNFQTLTCNTKWNSSEDFR